jgi:hypothetical protein
VHAPEDIVREGIKVESGFSRISRDIYVNERVDNLSIMGHPHKRERMAVGALVRSRTTSKRTSMQSLREMKRPEDAVCEEHSRI